MARIEKFARQFHIDQDWRRNFQYVQYNVKKSLFLLYFLLKIVFRTFRTWASELFVEVVLGAGPIFNTPQDGLIFSQSDLKPVFEWFPGEALDISSLDLTEFRNI